MTDLAAALGALKNLNHDELTDFIDLADYALEVPKVATRRKGKTPLDRLTGGAAWRIARKLPKNELILVRDMAATLRNALKPLEKRRRNEDGEPTARGYVQTKYITRQVLNRETLEFEKRTFGPYLYLRVWATAGDRDRRGKRLKNHYIGMKPLALRFEAGAVTADDIITAFEAGTLKQLQARVLGLPEED